MKILKIIALIAIPIVIFLFAMIIKDASKPKDWVFNEVHGSEKPIPRNNSFKFELNKPLNAGLSDQPLPDVSVIFRNLEFEKEFQGTFNKGKFIFKGGDGVKIYKIQVEILEKEPNLIKRDVVLYVCTKTKCYRDLKEKVNDNNFIFYIPFPENEKATHIHLTSYTYSSTFLGHSTYEVEIGTYYLE